MEIPSIDNITLKPLIETLRLQKIDDATYFSEKYSDYISNSRLGLLQKQGPKAFFEGFGAQTGYNPSFLLGSAVHMLTLQPEFFEMCDSVDLPSAKLGGMADYLYPYFLKRDLTNETFKKAAEKIDYYKDKMDDNRIESIIASCTDYWNGRKNYEKEHATDKEIFYLDPKLRDKASGCVKALHDNALVQSILHPLDINGDPIISENEQAILLDVEVSVDGSKPFIVRLKSKLDNYTIDPTANLIRVNDIKTTIKNTNYFEEVIDTYSYSREIAMYSFLLSLVCKKYYNMETPQIEGNFLVVSTIDPYYTRVVPMTRELYLNGFKQFKELLKLACAYKKYGYDE